MIYRNANSSEDKEASGKLKTKGIEQITEGNGKRKKTNEKLPAVACKHAIEATVVLYVRRE